MFELEIKLESVSSQTQVTVTEAPTTILRTTEKKLETSSLVENTTPATTLKQTFQIPNYEKEISFITILLICVVVAAVLLTFVPPVVYCVSFRKKAEQYSSENESITLEV